MVESLEDQLARAERTKAEVAELLAQLTTETEAMRAATSEAHQAMRDLRAAVKEAKEEMRQAGKAEARKHLAKQMRSAAEILARET
jgi:hypothetical protein